MPSEIQSGSSILRPRARLIKTIGEELISSDIVAVMELVKNSYDADATIISVVIRGEIEEVIVDQKLKKILRPDGASITISDDGKGMSLDTIRNAWMEPATIMKKVAKKSPGKSRRYTGEKGIGRFASAKLSSQLRIVTKEVDDNEVVVRFNWSDFANDELYLDEVLSSWEVREPNEILNSGTILYLENLNTVWDQEKLRSLKVALSRIINPVAPVEDFLIELDFPEDIGDFSGLIEAPDAIQRPEYSIKGYVDSNGYAIIQYASRKNPNPIDLSRQLLRSDNDLKPYLSGPFGFEFRVWDRENDALDRLAKEVGSTIKNVRDDLNSLFGVSVYRDNFRVLPYGEPKNDWLRLNARRVNNPTMRLSDNQIIGYINIGLDNNPELKDQSNREGIVESRAFDDLQDQIRSLLNLLEQKRYEERPRKEEQKENQETLYSSFSLVEVTEAISKKLPKDDEVLQLFAKTQHRIGEGIKKVQEVLARYRRLSTLGLLIDSILHDGGHFLLNMDGEILLLEKEFKKKDRDEAKIASHLKNIQEQRKVIAQLFKRIEPFGGRKKGRPSNIIIENAIKNVFEISKMDLVRLGIEYELPQTQNTVTIDNGELQMILVNLLQNSIYWLKTIPSNRKIKVDVERSDSELSMTFSDSGPGIPEEKAAFIFDPYYTTRDDGIGLGLTIIGELVAEYNGELLLLRDGPLDGATFKIIFRKRI